ncbi:MAG: hypothetical protein ACYTF0_08315, partial [Planctomycetota bacterium]
MRIEVLTVHDVDGGLADCDLCWDGVEVPGVVVGDGACAGVQLSGDIELDEIMGVRDAEPVVDGPWVSAGSGFISVVGRVERILQWGSIDVRSGDVVLMLDDEELQGWQP